MQQTHKHSTHTPAMACMLAARPVCVRDPTQGYGSTGDRRGLNSLFKAHTRRSGPSPITSHPTGAVCVHNAGRRLWFCTGTGQRRRIAARAVPEVGRWEWCASPKYPSKVFSASFRTDIGSSTSQLLTPQAQFCVDRTHPKQTLSIRRACVCAYAVERRT